MKNKNTAGTLAFLVGWLGIQWFYLGHNLRGILYICFVWTFIPAILAFIETIYFFTMSEEKFTKKYILPIVEKQKKQQEIIDNM